MHFGDLKEFTVVDNPCPHTKAQRRTAHDLGPFVRMVDLVNGSAKSIVRYWFQITWKTAERTTAGGVLKSMLKASPKVRPASSCWRIDFTRVPSKHLGLRKPARKRMLASSVAGGSLQTS